MNIVYTAILGGCDSLKRAPKGADKAILFSDDHAHLQDSNGWDVYHWPRTSWQEQDSRREAWRLRCVPHKLFASYDTVTWIDASFTLTNLPRLLRDATGRDLSVLKHQKRTTCYEEGREIIRVGQAPASAVQPQMDAYRRAGFSPSTLSISCIIVRRRTEAVRRFNHAWLSEIQRHPGDNTQLSLDYAAWRTGVRVNYLTGVRKDNPYAQHDHEDHKKRRKAYA